MSFIDLGICLFLSIPILILMKYIFNTLKVKYYYYVCLNNYQANSFKGIVYSKDVLDKILHLNKTGTLISYSSYKSYCELADKLIYYSGQLNCKASLIIAKKIKKAVLEMKHEEGYKI